MNTMANRQKIIRLYRSDRSLSWAYVEMMPDANLELPYEGAKEMLLVDDVEDKDFLRELIETMYNELPVPKKKK